ncbi:MAG: Dabb family protein, partial [Novipirellula sp. JB048]
IEHTVTFRLKHATGSEEEKSFLTAAAELATIPGVQDFQIRRQTSPKNPHPFGISMKFDSATEYQNYNDHPLHVRFVQQRWLKEVIAFQEADFEPLE